ncbi:magnesium transporter MRS2-F-like isoform X3 [Zingiber officinale]|uniref:magnesium transporter MRS2-F-like isoform X3 n=1 Tax=Zingiber officinale TaxID=94328 RepID=UPI001C4CB1A1|nr:magnesium transporter MRS2-F-like isoform X3 [Zingiber officinale]
METRRSEAEGPLSTRVAAVDDAPPTPPAPTTGRRKAGPVREWLVVSASGWSYQEEVGKHSIMRRMGLPSRDLRVLDTLLSYPSTILGRERAVVIKLEHIRVIVTATEVLIPNFRDPLVAAFVQDLKSRVSTSISPQQASELEKEAYPTLDELTSQINSLNLERVRQIKNHLVALSVRVQKVRDEIEHLLDDDMDMAEMHLTEKLLHQSERGSSKLENSVEPDKESDELESDAANGKENAGGFDADIHELEMLLEAYFMQVDGTLRKLSTLRDYVDDTEDYINIMLDDKQNHLLQMGVILSMATILITVGILVTGIFAINIHIPLYDSPYITFEETVGALVGGSIILFIIAIWWGRRSGILQ